MTISMPLDAPAGSPPPAPPGPAPTGPPPQIVSNRRRLDNRFPTLAFNIRTRGRPYFEVLLATDRTLFDPAAASRRTPSNFYAGRQDGGLLHATAEETAYVVPAAVLKRFAEAKPRPSEIFYTVAAYDTPEGAPMLAQPPSILATTAPSVLLGGDYQAKTMAAVLGVPAEKLNALTAAPRQTYEPVAHPFGAAEVDDDGIPVGEASSWSSEDDDEAAAAMAAEAWTSDPHAQPLDAGSYDDEPPPDIGMAAEDEDEAEAYAYDGHDDYDDEQATQMAADDWSEQPEAQAYDAPPDDYEESYEADDVDESYGEPEAYGADDDPYSEEAEADVAYDDGYGYDDEPAAEEAGWGEAAEASFPPGAAEPAQLADDEDRYEDELAYDSVYSNGNGASATLSAPHAPPAAKPLDIPAKVAIVTKIGKKFEARDGYAGVSADFEFSDPKFSQYQRWHVGLSYGFVQFTQDSGGLGQLLTMMRERDAAKFREIFGPDSDELVRVTNQPGPSGRTVAGGRSARVQPVGGVDIWQEPWVSRFRAAGAHPPFQAAQNELAVRMFVDPMLGFAAAFGMNTERALAMVCDRAIQQGVGGARKWIVGAIGPIKTDALRQQALGALGLPGIKEFQQANHLHVDGDFGPVTHAALTGALRRLGPASPIPVPTREQNMDAIVARAAAQKTFWAHRPKTIRTDADFADSEFTLVSP